MSRDFTTVPVSRLRKHELRALVVHMRLRHTREIEELLAKLPPEIALQWCQGRIRQKPSAVPLEAVSPTRRTES